MLVMEEYAFTFKMVNKTKNSSSERVAGRLTPPLTWEINAIWKPSFDDRPKVTCPSQRSSKVKKKEV